MTANNLIISKSMFLFNSFGVFFLLTIFLTLVGYAELKKIAMTSMLCVRHYKSKYKMAANWNHHV